MKESKPVKFVSKDPKKLKEFMDKLGKTMVSELNKSAKKSSPGIKIK